MRRCYCSAVLVSVSVCTGSVSISVNEVGGVIGLSVAVVYGGVSLSLPLVLSVSAARVGYGVSVRLCMFGCASEAGNLLHSMPSVSDDVISSSVRRGLFCRLFYASSVSNQPAPADVEDFLPNALGRYVIHPLDDSERRAGTL